MENQTLSIHQRIHAVMKDVTTIKKEEKKVNGQYSYVSHDEVTRVLHDSFVTHGIVMEPSVETYIQDGNRSEIMMNISFVNADKSDDRITVRYPGLGIDPQDKGIGKAISYAVKYALLKTFCLETSDDVEKDNIDYKPTQKKSEPKSFTPKPTTKELSEIFADQRLWDIKDIMRSDGGILEAAMKKHNYPFDVTLLKDDQILNILNFVKTKEYLDQKEVLKKRG